MTSEDLPINLAYRALGVLVLPCLQVALDFLAGKHTTIIVFDQVTTGRDVQSTKITLSLTLRAPGEKLSKMMTQLVFTVDFCGIVR